MSTTKILLIFFGILFAWGALFIMGDYIYINLLQTTIAVVNGGSYRPDFLEAEWGAGFVFCVVLSAICLAFGQGLDSEKPKDKNQNSPPPPKS